MKIVRIIAVFLLAVMLVTMFAACKNDGEGGGTTQPAVTTKPDDTLDENGFVRDNLDPSLNYGDTTFNIRCWEQSINEYDFESLTDDADDVDQALYNRNRKVEERLGVVLKYLPIAGGASKVDDFVTDVSSSVGANLGTYDAVAAYTRCAGVLGTQGIYTDLMTVDNIDTDMPWWPEEIVSTNTVAGKLFFATGDIATSLIYQMCFMIINREYAEELGQNVDELQQLALDGGWDLTTMINIAENAWKENDTIAGKSAGDKFGFTVTGHNMLDLFYMGAGLTYVTSDEDGLRLSDDYASALSQSILQKFSNAFNKNAYYYGSADITLGNSMLYVVWGETLSKTLRNANYTYHILPAPKYSAEQGDYYTTIGFPHSMYSIPKDAKDKAMSGAVLECMASESYRQVTPVLFDKVFLYKLTNATMDISLLTLIRDRATFDLGRTFFEELGADQSSPVRLWRNLVVNKSIKVQPLVNVNGDSWNKTLKDIYTKFANN